MASAQVTIWVPRGVHSLLARRSSRPRGWTVCGGAVGAREPQQRGVLSHTHASARARGPHVQPPRHCCRVPAPSPAGPSLLLAVLPGRVWGTRGHPLRAGAAAGLCQLWVSQTRAAAAQPVLAARTAVLTCRSFCAAWCAGDGAEVVPGTVLRSERACTEVQLLGCPQPSLAEDRGSCRARGRAGAAGSPSRLG